MNPVVPISRSRPQTLQSPAGFGFVALPWSRGRYGVDVAANLALRDRRGQSFFQNLKEPNCFQSSELPESVSVLLFL